MSTDKPRSDEGFGYTKIGSVVSVLKDMSVFTISRDRDGLVVIQVGAETLGVKSMTSHMTPSTARSLARLIVEAAGIN